jgi:hypothetical protein
MPLRYLLLGFYCIRFNLFIYMDNLILIITYFKLSYIIYFLIFIDYMLIIININFPLTIDLTEYLENCIKNVIFF